MFFLHSNQGQIPLDLQHCQEMIHVCILIMHYYGNTIVINFSHKNIEVMSLYLNHVCGYIFYIIIPIHRIRQGEPRLPIPSCIMPPAMEQKLGRFGSLPQRRHKLTNQV